MSAELISLDMNSVQSSKERFNQRLISSISKKLDINKISYTVEDVEKIVSLLKEGTNKEQLTEELTTMFANDKDKIKNSLINYIIGYSSYCSTPVQEVESSLDELKSPSIKSDRMSTKEKTENLSKAKRRISQSARSRRSIIDGTPLSPPPSPPKSTKASSVCSSDYEKSQKSIYHQKRLSRSANTLDLTSQVQSEIMAQTLALSAQLKNDSKEIKKERRKSIRSRKSSFSSAKEEDTSRIRCQYWPQCNRGDQCKFWHPKELCKKFPNCPNGDKCLYIHPALNSNPPSKPQSQYHNRRISQSSNTLPDLTERSSIECKYGANCTRLDCKFSHPSPAVAKLNKQNSVSTQDKTNKANVPCHFYPNCKNADCPYMHPTPKNTESINVACRFGAACTKKDCKFLHPSSRRI